MHRAGWPACRLAVKTWRRASSSRPALQPARPPATPQLHRAPHPPTPRPPVTGPHRTPAAAALTSPGRLPADLLRAGPAHGVPHQHGARAVVGGEWARRAARSKDHMCAAPAALQTGHTACPPAPPTSCPILQARQAIGRWLNSIRNTQRLLPTWLPPSEAHIVSEVARWLAALTPVSAAYLCRDPAFVNDHCSDLLNAEELSWLRGCANPPVKVLMVLSRIIKRCAAPPQPRRPSCGTAAQTPASSMRRLLLTCGARRMLSSSWPCVARGRGGRMPRCTRGNTPRGNMGAAGQVQPH